MAGGKLGSRNLRWGDLPTTLASQGLTIVGWAHGIAFPDKKQLTEYKAFLAEAAKRDHRKIGKGKETESLSPLILISSNTSHRLLIECSQVCCQNKYECRAFGMDLGNIPSKG